MGIIIFTIITTVGAVCTLCTGFMLEWQLVCICYIDGSSVVRMFGVITRMYRDPLYEQLSSCYLCN